MERLTIPGENLEDLDSRKLPKYGQLYWKLNKYEDLEEQCVKENSWCLRMLLHKWKEFVDDIQELYEYRKLEEQGKLLKLPCAVGDMVYVLKIDNSAYMTSNEKVWEIVEERFAMRHFDCVGKTVFLTREESEAALKELSTK